MNVEHRKSGKIIIFFFHTLRYINGFCFIQSHYTNVFILNATVSLLFTLFSNFSVSSLVPSLHSLVLLARNPTKIEKDFGLFSYICTPNKPYSTCIYKINFPRINLRTLCWLAQWTKKTVSNGTCL